MLISYRALQILQLAWGVWVCAYTFMWPHVYTHVDGHYLCVFLGVQTLVGL